MDNLLVLVLCVVNFFLALALITVVAYYGGKYDSEHKKGEGVVEIKDIEPGDIVFIRARVSGTLKHLKEIGFTSETTDGYKWLNFVPVSDVVKVVKMSSIKLEDSDVPV